MLGDFEVCEHSIVATRYIDMYPGQTGCVGASEGFCPLVP